MDLRRHETAAVPNANDYVDCSITTTCFTKGESVKAVWILDNINEGRDLDALIAEGSCSLEVGTGERKLKLRFFFKINEETYSNPKWNNHILLRHLSLWCSVEGSENSLENVFFKVKMDRLNDDLRVAQCALKEKAVSIHPKTDSQGKLVERHFLEFQRTEKIWEDKYSIYLDAYSEERHPEKHQGYRFNDTRSLQFGITVTILNLLGSSDEDGARALELPQSSISSPLSLAENLKKMYVDQDNFSDLKLETKDGMVTSAHKFILAARSPVLKALILEETSKDSFSGTIKIPDFNAKSILAILHWIYTGELSDRTGFLIDEVVIAAKKYQLTEMLTLLDKEMIKICNTGNMFQLFDAAKQNGLTNAMKQVSEFIKENIGSMINQM
ncbi:Rabankyrin-5 [Orchesella cincta]|uniref:Rabankyrin-5 n=1 Tax=Orchesella cincta TaxID=48709 RepID=A0A1D2M319_ORCCI|nr:Rabankyrin-5 [Orchesella cincta]